MRNGYGTKASACQPRTTGHSGTDLGKEKGSFTGIPGQTAYDCLRSMPFHADLALSFIDEYMGYIQFQSTIEILKSMSHSFQVSPKVLYVTS